jgi:hypothetical protein
VIDLRWNPGWAHRNLFDFILSTSHAKEKKRKENKGREGLATPFKTGGRNLGS